MSDPVRLVIADDHTLVRQSVGKLLAGAGFEVVAEAGSGTEAVSMVNLHEPDVVVLDVSMPGEIDGIEAAERIRAERTDAKIVLLTMHDDLGTLRRASDLSVDGFVAKTSSTEEVVDAVQAVSEGRAWVSSAVAVRMMRVASGAVLGQDLTEREVEILQLLAEGSRTDDIAETLFLAPKTVQNHLTNIYTKLKVETAAQAVARAYQHGLVSA